MKFSKKELKEIKKRFKWNRYNFILCIPVILNEDDYDYIYEYLDNKYSDIYLFDRQTWHISFSRFTINDFETLEKYLDIIRKINNDNEFKELIKENIIINQCNNYIMGKRYLCLETKINKKIHSIINKYFTASNLSYHTEKPHMSVGIMDDKMIIDKDIIYTNYKMKENCLCLILTEPLCVNDEDYYIELR